MAAPEKSGAVFFMHVIEVSGGIIIKADLFKPSTYRALEGLDATVAIADPPYGNIVSSRWDKWDDKRLADELAVFAFNLTQCVKQGAHLCMGIMRRT